MNSERGTFAAAAGLGALALFVVSGVVFLFLRGVPARSRSYQPRRDVRAVPDDRRRGSRPPARSGSQLARFGGAVVRGRGPRLPRLFRGGGGATVGSAGRGPTVAVVKTLLAASAAFFVVGFAAFAYGTVWGFVLVLPAWVVLPTIAGSYQTR